MILPMVQVELFGPKELLPAALSFLQDRGVLQLRAPAAGPEGRPLTDPLPVSRADEERATRLATSLAHAEALAPRLPAPGVAAEPLSLPPAGSRELEVALKGLEVRLDHAEARRTALLEERAAVETFSRLVVALAPLSHGLDPALEPELHGLVLKQDPAALSLLQAEARRITGGRCEITSRELPGGQVGVLLVVPRACSRELATLLFERGVDEVKLPASVAGRGLVEGLVAVAARQRELPGEIAAADAELGGLAAAAGPSLAEVMAEARAELDRLRAAGHCGGTRFAFVVAGWMPEERVAPMREDAAAAFGDRVAVLARHPPVERWGEVPVVLRNRPWARPFEHLLALVPLPRYGSVDPTPLMAVGFPLFFGMVLGDLVFGVLAAAAAVVALRRGWGGVLGADLARVALACAASAALFGLLFGEALGEVGAHFGLHPLLFERRTGLMALLALAVLVGLGHLLVGGALGVKAAWHGRHRREAVGRAGKLLMLAGGAAAVAVLLERLPPWALLWSLGAASLGLATALVTEGPMAALDVVLGLGHVLSYARLMALGLASAMLAEVANGIATNLRPLAAGLLLALLLHAVNFTLCLVSPIVAALRLHYVEFFEGFYEPGGAPFHPFTVPRT